MTTVILIRHGESEANREDIFAGHLNVDLMPKGVEQAQKTAQYIVENYTVDKIYASDLKRAYKTGKTLADKLGMEIIVDKRFREIDAGEWDGIKFNELGDKYAEEFRIWRDDIANAKCTGGESVEDLRKRVFGAATEVAENNDGKTVVIATHATPIRVMQTYVQMGSLEKMNDIPWVSNASVSVFEYDNGKWTCKAVSVDKHLGDLVTALPSNV
ncbi:MAG: histidine phosphatase family protein [Clostridia bacterium]|nr:histidine phosphatase family protein [Clostridia bacterium]